MTDASRFPELAAGGAAIHLMGIGGAGMAGLALLLTARGASVSGCDREFPNDNAGPDSRLDGEYGAHPRYVNEAS